LESAGAQHLDYSPAILPVKVMCLGRLSPGIILKAFEKGARGVLLLGCPPGECHYGFGNRRAEEVFTEARDLASLLGYGPEQLKLDWLATEQGTTFAAQVRDFVAELHGERVP
jgi:coenzyme F420-reducing hydrogenase delta subunit